MFYGGLCCHGDFPSYSSGGRWDVLEKSLRIRGEILEKSYSSAGEVLETLCANCIVMENFWRDSGEVLYGHLKFLKRRWVLSHTGRLLWVHLGLVYVQLGLFGLV
ncbi:hypothetical protein L798_12858 [Zootermopsis nevadensis]|uniref:Uncharacterized protein n=1 Tax=Zootermopsis nevadensis TaxID=136037 RepID=A0A067R2S8_ZOONE|nr:hypothetical protein L798_12858 [Zootermopsis nevadensis]